MPGRYLPRSTPINPAGVAAQLYLDFFSQVDLDLLAVQTAVAGVIGVNAFTVAAQPTLGAGDAGYIGYVTDYDHLVRWNGSVWARLGGDNAYFALRPVAPQGVGWQLCDGTVTAYLTFGATLTLTPFTTPDLVGSPAYLKSIGAYTGVINAKAGSTSTGVTGTGTTGTGTTGDEASHIHAVGPQSFDVSGGFSGGNLSGTTAPLAVTISLNTAAGSAHHHSVPGLTVPALTVPALGVGSIEMANLGGLPYFRK